MTGLLLALLLAAAPTVRTLYDDDVKVGAGRIRTLDIPLPEKPARIVCSYEVMQGGSGVRVVLLKREDADRWLRGEAHQVEASTPYARRGGFSHRPPEANQYQLVLDNRMEGRGTSEVHLLVRIVQGDGAAGPVQRVDRNKGQILVWGSMGLFAMAAVFTGVRVKQNLDRRG